MSTYIQNNNDKNKVLKEKVIVYCSASRCRFKRNDGYYNSCKNPLILEDNILFMGGHVYRDGCKCQGCIKDDCTLKEHQVSVLEEINGTSKLKLGDDSEAIYLCEEKN